MLYFIEGKKTWTPDLLAEFGLSRLIESPISRECMTGPEGHPGLVVCDEAIGRKPLFQVAGQTWVKRFGYPTTWLGCWDDWRPEPKHLARVGQLPGPSVKLLDGNLWQLPLIRTWLGDADEPLASRTCLPQSLRLHPETGKLVSGDIIREYKELWDVSCDIVTGLLEQSMSGETSLVLDEKGDRFVELVLQTNYRISKDEIGFLSLLSQQTFSEVAIKPIEFDIVLDQLKNYQSRLETGGASSQTQDDTDTNSGETPPTEAASSEAIAQHLGS